MRKIPKKVLGILLAMIFALISLTVYAAEANAANTGWQQSNGKWYYYDENGQMITEFCLAIGKYSYYFNENGEMQTGWVQNINGDIYWHYFNDKGQMAIGWQYIDGFWYYFNENGQMQTGWQTIGGKTYYFYDNGKMAVSTWVGPYYVNNQGAVSEEDSLILIYQGEDDQIYHTGDTITVRYKISQPGKLNSVHLDAPAYTLSSADNTFTGYGAGKSYDINMNYDSNGKAVFTSAGALPITGRLDGDVLTFTLNTASLSEAQLVIYVEATFTKANGETITYDNGTKCNYAVVSDVCADGKHRLNKNDNFFGFYECNICRLILFETDIISVPGTWMRDSKGWWYKTEEADEYGTDYSRDFGLTTDGSGKIYMGDYVKNQLVFIDGSWYYFNSSGYMQTGWVYFRNSWRYFNGSGALQFGWIKDGSNWYHTDRYGAMQTGWIMVGGKWYYLNASGHMVTGWQTISGNWYCFNTSGQMLTGWQAISGKWYYFNASGQMAIGWRQISGSWYYFNTSGQMVTGWQQISGKYYYFNSNGTMAVDTWVGNYYVDGSGVWTTSK